jgi:hypothetical protein
MKAMADVEQTVATLGRMTAGQLRAKYLELFGEPSRSGNGEFLARRCAWRIGRRTPPFTCRRRRLGDSESSSSGGACHWASRTSRTVSSGRGASRCRRPS